jgi:hypothetical protein
MKAKDIRTVLVTVAEVDDMIASLNAARSVRHLSGDQRRQLQEAYDDLVHAAERADDGKVPLHVSIIVSVLQCATMTQTWLSDMLSDLSFESENK